MDTPLNVGFLRFLACLGIKLVTKMIQKAGARLRGSGTAFVSATPLQCHHLLGAVKRFDMSPLQHLRHNNENFVDNLIPK